MIILTTTPFLDRTGRRTLREQGCATLLKTAATATAAAAAVADDNVDDSGAATELPLSCRERPLGTWIRNIVVRLVQKRNERSSADIPILKS